MTDGSEYSARERRLLGGAAAFGLVVVNGLFVLGAVQPGAVAQILTNPIALAFLGEAALLVAVLAHLLTKWGVMRIGWPSFVAIALVGSLLFAVPVAVLWGRTSGTDTRARRRMDRCARRLRRSG